MPQERSRHPFAAGQIAQPPRVTAPPPPPIQAPDSLFDRLRAAPPPVDRVAERLAREEARLQGALWARHREVETILGRRVPASAMMTGQDARNGVGSLPDAEYEAQIEALRSENTDRLAALESRADMAARLNGRRAISYYETPFGPAEARTRTDGSLWLSTPDGRSGGLARFPGARPVRASGQTIPAPEGTPVASPRERSLWERFTTTTEDVASTNPLMALGRWAVSRGPAYDEFEDPETGDTIRYASFGQQVVDYERERRDSYRIMAGGDAWNAGDASALHKLARGVSTLSGALGGSAADPTALIAPGRTAVGRVIGAVGVNAGLDVVAQGADVATGIENEYRPLQTALAAGLGAAVQGGAEGATALARSLDPDPGGVVGALAAEIDAGSRAVAAAPRPVPPAVRAALARIDSDRLDAQTIGPADGAAVQAAQRALDDLRMPPRPNIEREIDDLFGGADARSAQADTPAGHSPDAGGGNTGPGGAAGFEAAEYQGRQILSGSFDPMQVDVDAARFQFKQSGDEGLTDRLSGVTAWDRTAAGRSILFEDGDGRVIIADGHQRRGLARRLIQSGEDLTPRLDGFLMRSADGWTPSDVRVVAALKNLREDSGALLDAAKVLREAPHLANDRSLPITGEFMANARDLARLSDPAFGAVSTGVISERNGAVIGSLAADRLDLHLSMVNLIREGDPSSLDEARALVQEARLADFAEENGLQGDLFGGPPAQSTLIARARLRAAVLKQLRGDARLFSSLVRNADAIEAGGNALARTENEARLARDMIAYSAIDKLALRVGVVGDTFGDAAGAMTRGDLTLAQGARNIIDELRESSRMGDLLDAERRVTLDPSAPSQIARDALRPFDEPGGKGQSDQVRPKPEDAETEARASWDDLPEVTEEQRAVDVLRVCAPGGA
jgi:hypothetical protein